MDRSFDQSGVPALPDGGAYAIVSRYINVGWRYRALFVIVMSVILLLGSAAVFSLRRSYMAMATIVVTTPVADPLLQSSNSEKASLEDDELATQGALIKSRDVAAMVLRQFPEPPAPVRHTWRHFLCEHSVHFVCNTSSPSASNSANALDRSIDGLLSTVTVEPQANSRVINVSVKADTGERAAALTNAFVTSYQQLALTQRQGDLKREADWIDGRTAALRQRWLEAERVASTYNVQHGLVNTGEDSPLVDRQISDMASSLSQAQNRYAAAQARVMALNAAISGGDPRAMISLAEQPLLVASANALMQAEGVRAQKAGSFGPNHPDVLALDKQIAGANAQLHAETRQALTSINSELIAAKADVAELTHLMEKLQKQSAGQTGAQAEYKTLQQESTSARGVYEAFLDRAKELTDRVALLQPPVTFVSHAATPASPTFPNRNKLLMGVIVLALVAATSAVVLRAWLSPSFIDIDELRNFGGLPLLTILPRIKGMRKKSLARFVLDHPFSQAAEAMRGLSAQLSLAGGGQPIGAQVVAIASATPGDGKTTVATWLASALNGAGQSVLLIDLDYRRLTNSGELNLQMKKGFSDFFAGRATATDVIFKDDVTGIDVIPPGNPRLSSFDPAEVARIRDILRDLSCNYKMIIINLPPLAVALDGLIMASVADQTIFVCRWAHTSRGVAAACLDRLRVYGARMTGTVLTGADERSANLLCGTQVTRSEIKLITHGYQN
ncbi:AAA family ATPase [Acetobacter sp. LMG 1636]|uniref:non-specific protein-tyrosine kinase n=2 Tax=Acetobacter fallax TaxID=1737473 RepID=A0ABX0K7E1_9PROT|nr:AAA family ATPase [Acetobacter fallax]NHO35877.1 AAA family ATPase [Acetobacter fallax]